MIADDSGDRHSHAIDRQVETDPQRVAELEARNALRQFDHVVQAVEYWTQPDYKFRLRPSLILTLHRSILEDISALAGVWRPGSVEIRGSLHMPPGAFLVPELIEQLCEYVNEHQSSSPIHLAAYVLWRMNWIHPFVDGNGRTSRALAYLVLCVNLGYRLPGKDTIPEQIAGDKKPYYQALEEADVSFKGGDIDLSAMEKLLSERLATQLLSVYSAASNPRG